MPHRRIESKPRAGILAGLGLAMTIGAASLVCPSSAVAASSIAPKAVASAGSMTFCSDMTSPPVEFMTPEGQPTGSDIDIGNAIAKVFGVKAEWKNIPFSGLIPALLAHHCDVVISQMFDKPKRREVIDMVDYMYSSESLLVRAGDPEHIHSLADLSGKKVAVENGTTIFELISKQNDKFKAEGKPPASIVVYPKDTDALLALRSGQVDVYGTTLETAAYYMSKAPNTFEVAGPPFHKMLTAIGLNKNDPGMKDAIQTAVDDLQKNGTIPAILKKWGIGGDRLDNKG